VPPKNRRSATRTLSPAALRGALTVFQGFRARRGALTLAQLRALHRLLVTAREIRSAAIRLMDLAADVGGARDAPETPHRPPRPTVGRPRNRILERILEFAAKQGVPDAELARALADVGFVPDGPGSAGVDLADRWAAIIKSARARRRHAARRRPR
jgi:hypothetical protein